MLELHSSLQKASPSKEHSSEFITNVVLYMSFGAKNIHPKMNRIHLVIVFSTSSVNGNGKGSFFISTFNFLKSTQILNFPLFFGATTFGDNHVASSIGYMKPIVNNLSMYCFIAIT